MLDWKVVRRLFLIRSLGLAEENYEVFYGKN
jgi:hypothetical protein